MSYMRDADGLRLDGLSVQAPPNTVVWLGDSIVEKGGGIPANVHYDPQGFWVWAQDMSGHRLRTLKNAGVSGERTDQILARVNADVLALRPGWCHVIAGTNDVGQAVALGTIKTNLTAIWDKLAVAGIRVIAGTIPPRSSYTGSQLADAIALNAWIRDQGRVRRNFIVVDYHSVLVDAGATGAYAANHTSDGVHPSFIGAGKMGQLLAGVLKTFVPPVTFLPNSEGGTLNLIDGGRMNTGGVGSVPSGWGQSFSSAPTWSKTARTDGLNGSWQTVVVPTGANGILTKNARAGSFAVGDVVIAVAEYRATGLDQAAAGNSQGLFLKLSALNSGGSVITEVFDHYWVRGSQANFPAFDRSGVFRTPRLTVPTNTAFLQLNLTMAGGGTYDFDRAGIFNAAGLA